LACSAGGRGGGRKTDFLSLSTDKQDKYQVSVVTFSDGPKGEVPSFGTRVSRENTGSVQTGQNIRRRR